MASSMPVALSPEVWGHRALFKNSGQGLLLALGRRCVKLSPNVLSPTSLKPRHAHSARQPSVLATHLGGTTVALRGPHAPALPWLPFAPCLCLRGLAPSPAHNTKFLHILGNPASFLGRGQRPHYTSHLVLCCGYRHHPRTQVPSDWEHQSTRINSGARLCGHQFRPTVCNRPRRTSVLVNILSLSPGVGIPRASKGPTPHPACVAQL